MKSSWMTGALGALAALDGAKAQQCYREIDPSSVPAPQMPLENCQTIPGAGVKVCTDSQHSFSQVPPGPAGIEVLDVSARANHSGTDSNPGMIIGAYEIERPFGVYVDPHDGSNAKAANVVSYEPNNGNYSDPVFSVYTVPGNSSKIACYNPGIFTKQSMPKRCFDTTPGGTEGVLSVYNAWSVPEDCASSSPSATPTPTPTQGTENPSSGLSTGAQVGIGTAVGIGGTTIIALGAYAAWWCTRRNGPIRGRDMEMDALSR